MPLLYTTNLSEGRALAESEARSSGLPEDRVADFVIAVGELAANTVRHARSPGSMEIWLAGGELICEIRDAWPAARRRRRKPTAATACGWCTRSATAWTSAQTRRARSSGCTWRYGRSLLN